MSGCINRIASQINVTEDFLKGLADVLKNRAKDGVRYSREFQNRNRYSIANTIFITEISHTV